MLNRIKSELLNVGLKFINVDEKIVRMILETKPSNLNEIVILPAIKIVMKKLRSERLVKQSFNLNKEAIILLEKATNKINTLN